MHVDDNDVDIFLVNTFCQGYSQATAIRKSISMFSYALSRINSASSEMFSDINARNTVVQPFVNLHSAPSFLLVACASNGTSEILSQDVDQWTIMFDTPERYQ
jgi:hypothetical protein